MELLDAIRKRRSVREYTTEPVSRTIIEEMIASATLAPSAMNEQPWRYTVISNRELLDTISTKSKAHMLDRMKGAPSGGHFGEMLHSPAFHIFYHAPHLVVISARNGDWAIEDCALAAENLMLAAVARGIGSCWIGFAQSWLNTVDGKRTLGLDDDEIAAAPLIVGYPKSEAADVPRRRARIRWID